MEDHFNLQTNLLTTIMKRKKNINQIKIEIINSPKICFLNENNFNF